MAANISPDTSNARELSSRERLSRISHHFLSDDQPTTSTVETQTNNDSDNTVDKSPQYNKQPLVLPILMSLQQENNFPVYTLSQAMLAHNKSSAVLLVEGELSSSTRSMVFKSRHDHLHHNDQDHESNPFSAHQEPIQKLLQQTGFQHAADVYLIPIANITSPYVKTSRKILIPVQASLDGIRMAYLQLKRLATLKQEVGVGIVILKTNDPSWAQRCFEKLASAALRFLNLTITSYGYLPDITYPEFLTPQLTNITQGLPHEMMEVAEMLLFDLEPEHQDTEETALDEIETTSAAGMPWA
jgi:hypothetical protein